MNREIRDVMRAAEGRYLSSDEGERLLAAAKAYERRLSAMRAVEAKESEIISTTIERVNEKYPSFFQERVMSFDKCERDMSLVLRYCAAAMLDDDPSILNDKILHWMVTVLRAYNFGEVARGAYSILRDVATKSLDEAHAVEIEPYLTMCVDAFAGVDDKAVAANA